MDNENEATIAEYREPSLDKPQESQKPETTGFLKIIWYSYKENIFWKQLILCDMENWFWK